MDSNHPPRELPTGTVTFMFTDIESSTELAQSLDSTTFSRLLLRHHELMRGAIRSNGGTEVATEGDAFFAVFTQTEDAIETAVDIQRAIADEPWPNGVDLKVRIGLHTGEGVLGGDNYIGVAVHRASRIAHAAHGGQVAISDPVAQDMKGRMPPEAGIVALGKFNLAGFREAETLYQLEIEGLPNDFPPLRGVTPLSRLPEQLTEFVGREEELDLGVRLLDDTRLVTLTGPGGSGKTRLSIELARRAAPRFPDGAFFVSLASTSDPGLIPTAIAESLGLNTAANVDPTTHLLDYLADKQLIVVLDNLEQLLPGAAELTADILKSSPQLSIIATTRAPLRVSGERELAVPPLPIPDEGTASSGRAREFASIQLFRDRARAVRPTFELNEENLGTIVALTQRLDGLPLAIELAASQVRTFTPGLILQRMGNRMLTTATADLPPRQRTIVDTIGWSYDLLDHEAKMVFERCSVFSGSFGLAEAEEICGSEDPSIDVLNGLAALVENSLIQHTESAGHPRYQMLIVIKEYAYAALAARGEADGFEERHARTYLALAERAQREILTSKQGMWLDRLTSDHGNLRAAFDWAVRSEHPSIAQRLVAALWRFWQIRGHLPEARQRAETALALPGGTDRERAKTLLALGGIMYWQGEWTETLEPYDQALKLLREHGDEAEIADATFNAAFPHGFSGDHEKAERLLQESLAISQRIGDRIGVSRAYWGLGDMAVYRQDWKQELTMMLKAAEELEGEDAPFDLGWTHFMTAYGYQQEGSNDEARRQLLLALDIFAEVSDLSAMTLIFESLGLNAVRSGDPIRAARLAGAAHRLKHDTGVEIAEVSVNRYEEFDELLESKDPTIRAAYEEGSQMSIDEAVVFARGLTSFDALRTERGR